jgi:DNA-binding beta-propeller fold protein YncE
MATLMAMMLFPLTQVYGQDQGLTNIPIGKTALDVQIAGGKVYVTNPEEGAISIIDATSKQV